MRGGKYKVGGGIAVLVVLALDQIISWLLRHLVQIPLRLQTINDIDLLSDEELDAFGERLGEHEEAEAFGRMGGDAVPITLTHIHFGDLSMDCPDCDQASHDIMVGIGMAEDTESEEGDVNDITSIGVIAFPCGHSTTSPCLSEKVALLLNAGERGHLSPSFFINLTQCEHSDGEQNGDD